MAAVVAFHSAIALVVRHRDSAVLTFKFLSARAAQNDRRVPAAVEENHHLLAFFETFADFLGEFARDHLLLPGFLKLLAHVDDLDFRERPFLDAIGQLDERVLMFLGVVIRL